EYFEAELQELVLKRGEVLAYRAVRIPESWIAERITRLDSEPRERDAECVLVEPDGGIGEGCGLYVRITAEVPELVAAAGADAGVVEIVSDGERRAGLRLEYARKLPITEHPPRPR